MSEPKLLPCPFCGSEPHEPADVSEKHETKGAWITGCTSCDCRMDAFYDTEAEAIAAWNRRTPSEPVSREAEPDEPFAHALAALINRYSLEGESDTPDFILANYLDVALQAFIMATNEREQWYGRRESSTAFAEAEVRTPEPVTTPQDEQETS